MSKKEIVKRYCLFVISLFVLAVGVALAKTAGLGVSPISSVANVMNCRFTNISLGTWLVIWNCILIAGQIILLNKNFKLIQLLQIPLSFLFGYFTDFAMFLVSPLPADTYFAKIVLTLMGVVVLGLGVSLAVIADVIMNSAEAFVKAISDVWNLEFGSVKIGFDISCVVISAALSLIFFNFKIVGIREGTLIAAVCTGFVVKFFCRILSKRIMKTP